MDGLRYAAYAAQIIGLILGVIFLIMAWQYGSKNKTLGFMMAIAGLAAIPAGSLLSHMIDPEAVNVVRDSASAFEKTVNS